MILMTYIMIALSFNAPVWSFLCIINFYIPNKFEGGADIKISKNRKNKYADSQAVKFNHTSYPEVTNQEPWLCFSTNELTPPPNLKKCCISLSLHLQYYHCTQHIGYSEPLDVLKICYTGTYNIYTFCYDDTVNKRLF